MDGLIAGFERRRLPGHGVEIDALVGGAGTPLLLLHGYPQTRLIWSAMAPQLAAHFTLVMPDLRGYGRSDKPKGDPAHQTYAKRTMALDQVSIMAAIGFPRFAVAGHDRGGRVAYRLALDHPDKITALAVLDIIPTADMFARADAAAAMKAYHWYMLAQPHPLPETLIAADPAFFLRWTLQSWAAPGFAFNPDNVADYIACFTPDAIHATCEDYRAGYTLDRAYDEADRGRNRITAPLLALWGGGHSLAAGNPLEAWRAWATQPQGQAVPGGHFIPEEAPDEAAAAFIKFFKTQSD